MFWRNSKWRVAGRGGGGGKERKFFELYEQKNCKRKKFKETIKDPQGRGNIRVSVKNPVEIPSPVSLQKKQVIRRVAYGKKKKDTKLKLRDIIFVLMPTSRYGRMNVVYIWTFKLI